MVRQLRSGYTIVLTVPVSPDEDRISLKYVLHLTASQRQVLTRSAKGRCGHRCPPLWQVERARALLKCDSEPEGAGWTDEAVADALDIVAGTAGRWPRQAVAKGPEAVLER